MQNEENENKSIQLLPAQHEALTHLYDPNIREILLAGSAGSSKSFAGMYYALRMLVEFPNFRVGLFRKNLTDTLKSTINTLDELLTLLNIPKHWMTHDRLTNVFTFENGSEIYLLSAENKPSDINFSRWGGYEFSIIIFEEASEISAKAYSVAKSRMRYKPQSLKGYNFTHKAICITNPDSASWLYDYFYLRHINGELPDHIKYVHSLLEDNPYLDEDYKQSMREEPVTEIRNRLYLGLWVQQTNDVLITQTKIDNLFKPLNADNYKLTHISVDVARFGADASIVCLWSDLICVQILKFKNKSTKELSDEIKKLMKKYDIPAFKVVIDVDGVGAGACDNIRGSIGIHNGGAPINKENYQNLKTQLYYKFSELSDQITIICDSETTTAIKKEFGAVEKIIRNDDKYKITPKDVIKQKIGKSPDYSDALAYGMYFQLKKNTGLWHLYT